MVHAWSLVSVVVSWRRRRGVVVVVVVVAWLVAASVAHRGVGDVAVAGWSSWRSASRRRGVRGVALVASMRGWWRHHPGRVACVASWSWLVVVGLQHSVASLCSQSSSRKSS
ncbi:hypothetical protein ACXZ9C_10825 [Streptococcus agalactiae]